MLLDTDDIWFCEKCRQASETGSPCDCEDQATISPRGDAAGVGKSSPAVQSQTTAFLRPLWLWAMWFIVGYGSFFLKQWGLVTAMIVLGGICIVDSSEDWNDR